MRLHTSCLRWSSGQTSMLPRQRCCFAASELQDSSCSHRGGAPHPLCDSMPSRADPPGLERPRHLRLHHHRCAHSLCRPAIIARPSHASPEPSLLQAAPFVCSNQLLHSPYTICSNERHVSMYVCLMAQPASCGHCQSHVLAFGKASAEDFWEQSCMGCPTSSRVTASISIDCPVAFKLEGPSFPGYGL